MREILFRGKAANRIEGRAYRTSYKNGDWVEGLLTWPMNYRGFAEMTNTNGVSGIEVDPETVGQYTGLTDLHGKKIFEGDFIKIRFESDSFTHPYEPIVFYDIAKVFWSSEHYGWYAAFASGEELSMWEYDDPHDVEIVGNIHDNPELLGEKHDC